MEKNLEMKSLVSTGLDELDNLTEESLSGKSRPEQADRVLTFVIKNLGALDYASRVPSPKILEEYKNLRKKRSDLLYLTDASIKNYLSILSRQDWSAISCPGTKQGYFLSDYPQNTSVSTQDPTEKRQIEASLYPYLTEWLLAEGYMYAEDISLSRSMYKWGNPDILGINIDDVLGVMQLEVATIEVKKDNSQWRTDIFEAVSHSMFANRVYYAYKRKRSEKDDKEMILYAQKFRIGILAIVFPDDEAKSPVDNNDIDIQVIVPAFFNNVVFRLQKRFLEGLKLANISALISRKK